MKRVLFLITLLAVISCGKENMAGINTDPSEVNKPNIRYLLTDAQVNLMSGSYLEWFYDYTNYMLPWLQMTVGNGGEANSSTFNQMGAYSDRYRVFYDQLGGPIAKIQNLIEEMPANEASSYRYINAIATIMHIYNGIKVTDITGDMPYTEALKGLYTTPPLLTPKFDAQKDLLPLWAQILKQQTDILSNEVIYQGVAVPQVPISAQQDIIYGGVISKWTKLANTLQLKIAVRLYNTDPEAAKAIVGNVIQSGKIMTTIEDDFYWYGGATKYNFENTVSYGVGSNLLVNFLRTNKDPRLRFVFTKNAFNSRVVQGFLDRNVPLPDYIEQDANITEVNGKKTFTGWGGDGEPWVRYVGAPVTINGEISTSDYQKYFDVSKFQLSIGNTTRTFFPTSFFCANMVQPDKVFTYPDVSVISTQYKPNGNYPYRQALVTAAETQFYLAEFALKGVVGTSASRHFDDAVDLSVRSFNRAASDMNIPYYREVFDVDFEKPIALQPGEIDALLQRNEYSLTGDVESDLEKVYLNLMINNLLTPTDLYVTARRSGVPKESSTLFARQKFSASPMPIPRRFIISEPLESNINYQNAMDAYKAQGFTLGTNIPIVLESERIWYDKTAPAWGK